MNLIAKSNHFLIPATLIATTLSACGGGGGSTSDDHFPETLAYVASDGLAGNGVTELYAVDDDGQNNRRLSVASAQTDTDIQSFAISPDGQWVAYLSDVDSGFEIDALYVVPIDGSSAPVQISRTVNPGLNRSVKGFAWSPDSRQIAYTANLDGSITDGSFFANEVYLVNRDGSGEQKINGTIGNPPKVEVRNPQWSPDGHYILQEVARLTNGQGDVNAFAVNIYDTTTGAANSTRLVTAQGSVRNVHWSPDSTRFSYRADLQTQDDFQVYVTTASGSTTTQVTEHGDFNSDSRWSPDGSLLAYLDNPSQPFPADLVISAATNGAPDTVLVYLSPEGRQVTDFEWSPDGQRIAYRADQDTANQYELYVINADGSGSSTKVSGTMTANGDAFAFVWSPDGDRIAYIADQTTDTLLEAYTSKIDGSDNTRLTAGLSGEEAVDLAWSADSQRVAFSTGPTGRTPVPDKLYASRPDGGGRLQLNDTTSAGPVSFSY